MATWSRSERVLRTVEYTVPTNQPWGACWTEVMSAVNAVMHELRAAGRLGEHEEPTANTIRFLPGDDEIIISYEIKEA